MNNIFFDKETCHLMLWETNPSKRNSNNTVKFYLRNDFEIKVGDAIEASVIPGSYYEIQEVVEIRPSKMKNLNYVVVKTKWHEHLNKHKYNSITKANFEFAKAAATA